MTPTEIAILYIALNVILSAVLSILVSKTRGQEKIQFLYGHNNENVIKAVRAHANNTEYTPLALLAIFGLATVGAAAWMIHTLGVLLTVGRAWHAQGLYSSLGVSIGRVAGQAATWLVMLVASGGMIYYVLF